jgi:hypothetical protein
MHTYSNFAFKQPHFSAKALVGATGISPLLHRQTLDILRNAEPVADKITSLNALYGVWLKPEGLKEKGAKVVQGTVGLPVSDKSRRTVLILKDDKLSAAEKLESLNRLYGIKQIIHSKKAAFSGHLPDNNWIG